MTCFFLRHFRDSMIIGEYHICARMLIEYLLRYTHVHLEFCQRRSEPAMFEVPVFGMDSISM